MRERTSTHDGKLLAEYDDYTLDQINSTRMITNDTGVVVYSAAHDPYGAIEKTLTSSLRFRAEFIRPGVC